MTKVLVLYYSSYGHMEQMANAAAEGAREARAEVAVKRVPELAPEEVARKSGFKLDQPAPVATVNELPDYDAIILGELLGSDRRALGTRRAQRQGRQRDVLDRHPARRPGDDPVLGHHQPAASRPGDRRAALFVPGPDDARRDRRWLALRGHDHRGRPGPASAVAE